MMHGKSNIKFIIFNIILLGGKHVPVPLRAR